MCLFPTEYCHNVQIIHTILVAVTINQISMQEANICVFVYIGNLHSHEKHLGKS